jgi:hypothetical protein
LNAYEIVFEALGEHSVMVFGENEPRMLLDHTTEEDEELHNLYASTSIIANKSRTPLYLFMAN